MCKYLNWDKSYLEILNFFDELDVFLRQPGFVRRDVDDGTVEFFDPNVDFANGDLQFFGMFHAYETFLVEGFYLRKEFVNFSLEFALFFLGPEKMEK